MNTYRSKKWLGITLAVIALTSLLTGCPANNIPADQAFKEAYNKMWIDSYDYEGTISIEIKEDESALLGTKGGLNETEAQQELLIAENLQSPDGQQILTLLHSGKMTFHGAADNKNKQYDIIIGVDYEQNGIKMAMEVPVLIDLKEEPALYIDPKAASVFNLLPPQLNGKLVKISAQDFPNLTEEQKTKFKANGPAFKKVQEILTSSINKLDAGLYKDIEVTEEAKKVGATRTIQLMLTPEQNTKMSNEIMGQLLDAFAADFGLTTTQITQYKQQILTNNKNIPEAFMGNSVTQYSLNGQGQIVYVLNSQQLKGAKHTGKITMLTTLKSYGKPTLTIDPSKQESINFTELMDVPANNLIQQSFNGEHTSAADMARVYSEMRGTTTAVEAAIFVNRIPITTATTNPQEEFIGYNVDSSNLISSFTITGIKPAYILTATLGKNASPDLHGVIITLKRNATGGWTCVIDSSNSTNFKEEYRPKNCTAVTVK